MNGLFLCPSAFIKVFQGAILEAVAEIRFRMDVMFKAPVQSHIKTTTTVAQLGPAAMERGNVNHACRIF